MSKAYKIRRFQNGKNASGEPFYNHSLTIPSEIAEQLPENMRFQIEILDDLVLPDHPSIPEDYRGRSLRGLLFQPILPDKEPTLPGWAKEAVELDHMMETGENGAEPRRKPRKRPGSKPKARA